MPKSPETYSVVDTFKEFGVSILETILRNLITMMQTKEEQNKIEK